MQYQLYVDPITGDVYRDGVRGGKYVIDVELNHFPGFDGIKGVDWENILELE